MRIIAGPSLEIAHLCKDICVMPGIEYYFKASYDIKRENVGHA